MASIINPQDNSLLSRFVTAHRRLDTITVSHRALDGSIYLQTTGAPAVLYELKVYICRLNRPVLDELIANGALLLLVLDNERHSGRVIKSGSDKALAAGYSYLELTLAEEVQT